MVWVGPVQGRGDLGPAEFDWLWKKASLSPRRVDRENRPGPRKRWKVQIAGDAGRPVGLANPSPGSPLVRRGEGLAPHGTRRFVKIFRGADQTLRGGPALARRRGRGRQDALSDGRHRRPVRPDGAWAFPDLCPATLTLQLADGALGQVGLPPCVWTAGRAARRKEDGGPTAVISNRSPGPRGQCLRLPSQIGNRLNRSPGPGRPRRHRR